MWAIDTESFQVIDRFDVVEELAVFRIGFGDLREPHVELVHSLVLVHMIITDQFVHPFCWSSYIMVHFLVGGDVSCASLSVRQHRL